MNTDQLKILGEQLLQIAAAVRPDIAAEVAAVRGVLEAANQLNTLVREIRDNPDMAEVWAKVTADYAEAADAFRAG